MTKTESLRELVNEYAHVTFEWGTFDCCQFAAQHIQNVRGGLNPASRWCYTTENGADEIVAQEGGIKEIASQAMSGDPTGIDELEIGDLVLVDLGLPGEALGIKSSKGAIVLHARGLLSAPAHRIIEGWKF